jgi:hypothetical protein
MMMMIMMMMMMMQRAGVHLLGVGRSRDREGAGAYEETTSIHRPVLKHRVDSTCTTI